MKGKKEEIYVNKVFNEESQILKKDDWRFLFVEKIKLFLRKCLIISNKLQIMFLQ